MNKLVMTLGLPGSGKSTWAMDAVDALGWKRVNKDDLRRMVDNGEWGPKNEKVIVSLQEQIVRGLLQQGYSVVVDDTGFTHEARWGQVAADENATFEIKDFTEVPLEVCIERDLKRLHSVGEKVIKKMHKRYLAHRDTVASESMTWVEGLPSAVMVDIDGTVAVMAGRSPYDPSLYHTDKANDAVVRLVQDLHTAGERIVFCSGRDDTYRDVTAEWIGQHVGVPVEFLFMRPAGDQRKDAIVKRELYEANIKGKFNVRFVLDDRDQVVEMWRDLGLSCFQVGFGDF